MPGQFLAAWSHCFLDLRFELQNGQVELGTERIGGTPVNGELKPRTRRLDLATLVEKLAPAVGDCDGVAVLGDGASRRSGAISLRRTPSCQIDLASLASRFDGGGHAAAAGCTMQLPEDGRSTEIAIRLAEIVGSEGSS